jgi:hypothetical protein
MTGPPAKATADYDATVVADVPVKTSAGCSSRPDPNDHKL